MKNDIVKFAKDHPWKDIATEELSKSPEERRLLMIARCRRLGKSNLVYLYNEYLIERMIEIWLQEKSKL